MDEAVLLIAERAAKGPSKIARRRRGKAKATSRPKGDEAKPARQAESEEQGQGQGQGSRHPRGGGVGTHARWPANRRNARRTGLPSKDEILQFIQNARVTPGKREISRAFSVKGSDRVALKQMLTEMADEGLLSGNRKGFKERGQAAARGGARNRGPRCRRRTDRRACRLGRQRRRAPPRARPRRAAARRARGRAGARPGRPHPGPPHAPGETWTCSATATRRSPSSACRRRSARQLGIFRARAKGGGHRSRRSQGAEGMVDRARRRGRRQGRRSGALRSRPLGTPAACRRRAWSRRSATRRTSARSA